MSNINLSKILSTKLYRVDNILVDSRKRSKPLVNILLGVDLDSYFKVFNYFRFVPNNVKKIYYPKDKFNNSTMGIKVDTQSRIDHFSEIRANKVPFKIIADSSKIEELPANNTIVMDFSKYREDFDLFVISRKKTGTAQFTALKQVINHINTQLPKKCQYQLIIDIDNHNDPLVQCINNSLIKNFKELFALFSNMNVLFVSSDAKLVYKADFSNINQKTVITRLLNKALKISESVQNNEPVALLNDPDVKTVSIDDSSASDNELYIDSQQLDHDFSPENETKDIHDDLGPEVVIPDAANTLEPTGDEDNADDTENYDDEKTLNKADDETGEVETNDESDIDFDALLDVKSLDLADEKLQRENKAFLDKMIPIQNENLKPLVDVAEKLAEDKKLDILTVNDDTILNPHVKNVMGSSITNSYYSKQYKKDVLDILKSLNNDPEHPVVVTKVETRNVSTALSKLEELSVEFTDKKMRKHTFKVDVPILSHDGFLYINGNRNFIAKQAVLLPVIKESNERVQITTNYRKTFLYRKGDKINGQIDRLTRLLADKEFDSIAKKYGNSYDSNLDYSVSIPYNYMAKKLFSLSFDSNYVINFCQENIRDVIKQNGFNIDFNKFNGIGYRLYNDKIASVLIEDNGSRNIIEIKKINGKDVEKKINNSFIELLTDLVENSTDDALKAVYRATKPSISLSYTEVKILSSSISLGALVASFKGVIPALQDFNIKHRLSDVRSSKSNSEILIPFKNAYLYIDTEFNPSIELFVNGLFHLNTKNYNIEEAVRMSPIFLEYYESATGSRNSAKGLLNFESSFIDPITLEVLKELKLPTGFIELLMYGNGLLGDYNRDRKNDMNHFRVRDSEVIAVALYNSLADAFNNYKKTIRSGIPQTISVKKDDVIRKLQTMNNVEGYSTLNPVLEAEIKAKTTFKGPSGLNSSDAYTPEMLAYDKSMLGLYGVFTPIGSEVGVSRSMSLNPRLESTRGYLKKFDLDKADATNLFSVGELLNGFTPKHADSPRVIMSTTQSKHITPTKRQTPNLVGCGVDKSVAYMVGQTFAKLLGDFSSNTNY